MCHLIKENRLFLDSMFFKRINPELNFVTDIHSHILPGIDDGAEKLDDSIDMIEGLLELKLKNLYFSPHINSNKFLNTDRSIKEKYELLKNELIKRDIRIKTNICAEYFIDTSFRQSAVSGNKFICLPFDHVLVETSLIQKSMILSPVIFELREKGFIPILAHPERYLYFKKEDFRDLKRMGCRFQLNMLSLVGYYGKSVKGNARELVKESMIDFAGTDLHNKYQIKYLKNKRLINEINAINVRNDIFL